MEAIKDTVQKVIQQLQRKKTETGPEEPQGWLKKALTKRELQHIKFNYFRKGILGISVDSSGWLYSLSLQKESLLVKLREKAPELKDIRFHIGEVK